MQKYRSWLKIRWRVTIRNECPVFASVILDGERVFRADFENSFLLAVVYSMLYVNPQELLLPLTNKSKEKFQLYTKRNFYIKQW